MEIQNRPRDADVGLAIPQPSLSRPWVWLLYVLTVTHMIFLKGWGDTLGPSPRHFWWPDFSVGMLLPAFAFTLFLAFTFIQVLLGLASRLGMHRVHRLIHLLLMAWALLGLLRMGLPLEWKMAILTADKRLIGTVVTIIGAGMVLLSISKSYGPQFIRAFVNMVLVFSPLIPVLWGQALYALVVRQEVLRGKGVATQSALPRPRGGTIWVLLFDELDQRYAFDNPPVGLNLQAFSNFKRQAVTATKAYPPGNSTTVSIPTLLLGKVVKETHPISNRTARLVPFLGSPFDWAGENTIFQDFQNGGLKVSAFGWYLPYGRLFKGTADRIQSNAIEYEELLFDDRRSIWRAPLLYTAEALAWGHIAAGTSRRSLISMHTRNLRHAISFIQAEVYGGPANMVWVHFPIPHSPGIEEGGGGYVDNLKASDEVLGSLETLLRAHGRWDTDTIMVTSDHWVRLETARDSTFNYDSLLEARAKIHDHRVPFMVKMPGQRSPLQVTEPFQTVQLREMLNLFRRGRITDSQQLVEWMNTHASKGEGEGTISSHEPGPDPSP